MKIDMTHEEILNQLYKDRKELWNKATWRYARGIGEPYPKELEEIDEQIKKIEQIVSPIDRIGGAFITNFEPQPNYTIEDIEAGRRQNLNPMYELEQRKVEQRENQKFQRILQSKEDKRIHALKIIKEHTEPYYPESKSISIEYWYFNYESTMVSKRLFDKFLEEAKALGCFSSFHSTPSANRRDYGFQEVDLEKIQEYINKLGEEKPVAILESCKSLDYDPESGSGSFQGTAFKLTDGTDEYKIFNACWERKGKKLNRVEVEKILGIEHPDTDIGKVMSAVAGSNRKKRASEVSSTSKINEVTKKIRKKTSLGTKIFVLNSGNITLKIPNSSQTDPK